MMELNFKTNDIAFEVKEHVAYILLNKPEQYNPISAEAMQDLSQCLTYCEEHDDVRAVVIRGAGGNFSAGGNVKAMKERLDRGINVTKRGIRNGGEFIMRLKTLPKPTIAWVEGAVAGVGMSITLACDFSIVEETAKMVFAFVNIGFVPDGGMTYLLSRLVGSNKAAELLHHHPAGKHFPGRFKVTVTAQCDDLCRAVPKDQLEETVQKYIKKYAQGPSVAYAQMKRLLFNAAFPELNACMQNEVEAQYVCSLTEDHREALTAFVEKRKPVFRGR